MSAKTDALNRTWTLLPEDEDMPMEYETDETDDRLFHATNRSNLLDEEEMCVDLTCQSEFKNRTRILNENSCVLEETRLINKTVSLNVTVNKSPIAMKESLSANISYDLAKITEELENSFTWFNSIDANYESLFNETIVGLDPKYIYIFF